MQVEVHLFANLQLGRFARSHLELAPGATVDTLLEKLVIQRHEVEGVYINTKQATFQHQLKDNDRVTLLPFIGGG